LDFHKIRKLVSRSGSFLGTDKDSQAHPWEHLMIVYYDLLMVDNESLLAVKHSERFQRLKSLITVVPGRSALVKREVVDCTRRSAVSDLRRAFAKCITARGEGLVLKADDPYFDFGTLRRPYSCCAIKLKKEYIGGFGDIGDFAVVGARFDAAKARTYNIPRVKWTHFYVGCLENKDEVNRFGKQPRFVVTNVVELNATQLEDFMSSVNPESVRPEDNRAISLRIEPGVDNGKRPSVIFPAPPVFDIRCFSFDKEGNTGFWSPRFPSVAKIHCDRTYHDVVSFAELQEMAAKEREAAVPDDSQELLGWIAALEKSEPLSTVDTTSQSTSSTTTAAMTQSPLPLRSGGQLDHAALASPMGKIGSTTAIRAAPIGGQLTLPTSSSAHMPGSTSSDDIGKPDGAALTRKRPLESSAQNTISERSKVRRCSSESVDSAAHLPENNRVSTSAKQPEPLADTQPGTSRRNTQAGLTRPSLSSSVSMHQPDSGDKLLGEQDTAQPAAQTSMSFHGRPSQSFSAASPTAQTNSGAPTNQPAGNPTETMTTAAKCPLFPDTCKIPTYSILLSPCVADFPWVTDDLLSCHGVTEFLRDPKEWLNNNQDDNDTTNRSNSSYHHRKKLVLVDGRRREATVAFLESIEAAQLKRSNGERQYVPVYHWKVLEAIRDEEMRYSRNKWKLGREFNVNGSSSLWRQFWVGLA
jgi:DNA ligase-4